jgi:hypothetical protein
VIEGRAAGEPFILVAERRSRVHFLWGFLTAVSILVLVLAYRSDSTLGNLIVVYAVFGLILVGSVAAWIWFVRHPARLEVSYDEISFGHGPRTGVRFTRDEGDLFVRQTMVGKTPTLFLMVTGSDEAIPLGMFDLEEIRKAAAAAEWRFVEDPGPR